jgi:hypothetical protein
LQCQASGLTIPIGVNIGARQLQQEDVVASLAQMHSEFPDVRGDTGPLPDH